MWKYYFQDPNTNTTCASQIPGHWLKPENTSWTELITRIFESFESKNKMCGIVQYHAVSYVPSFLDYSRVEYSTHSTNKTYPHKKALFPDEEKEQV